MLNVFQHNAMLKMDIRLILLIHKSIPAAPMPPQPTPPPPPPPGLTHAHKHPKLTDAQITSFVKPECIHLLKQYFVPSSGSSFSGHFSKQKSVLGSFASRHARQSEGNNGSAPGLRQPKESRDKQIITYKLINLKSRL